MLLYFKTLWHCAVVFMQGGLAICVHETHVTVILDFYTVRSLTSGALASYLHSTCIHNLYLCGCHLCIFGYRIMLIDRVTALYTNTN